MVYFVNTELTINPLLVRVDQSFGFTESCFDGSVNGGISSGAGGFSGE